MLFDGLDLRSVSLKSVHDQLGMVSQETQLFAQTIMYNLLYGAPPDACTPERVVSRCRLNTSG